MIKKMYFLTICVTIIISFLSMTVVEINSSKFDDFQRMDKDQVSLEGKDRVAAILKDGRSSS